MSEYIKKMREMGKFPVVLRYERMGPADLRRFITHADPAVRKNLRHVDEHRIHMNTTPHGSIDALEKLYEQTEDMATFNLESNLVGLKSLSRKKELAEAKAIGLTDPWDHKAEPWRQCIATVHHEYFLADADCPTEFVCEYLDADGVMIRADIRKQNAVEAAFIDWMKEEHGDAFTYARGDRDEQGMHLHGVFAHQELTDPSGRFAGGRMLWKPSVHPHFRNELDDQRRKSKSGYEIAQDSIGAFFARPEYAHMNIVRGEPKAAKCRQAIAIADDLIRQEEAAGWMGDGEAVPDGSRNARAMFVLKKRMAEAVAEKGSADKIRSDAAAELAAEYLELLGAITPRERAENSTRRARNAMIKQHEETFGTAAEIVAAPDKAAEKYLRQAREKIAKENQAAATERTRLDALAATERAQKAAADEARREKKFAAREAALEASMRAEQEARDRAHQRRVDELARRHQARVAEAEAMEKANSEKAAMVIAASEKVAAREVEIERKIGWMNETLKHMQTLGDQIMAAAIKLDLMKDPIVELSMRAVKKIRAFTGYDRQD